MKKLKINLITIILFSAIATKSNAQQNLFSTFNNNAFSQGDTINFEVGLNNNENKIKTASIHLWIEDIATGRKWHYKYPLINGNLAARLVIDSSLFPGNYAFNFLLQKNFFRIKGEVKNPFKKDKQINYVLLSKNKDIVPGELTLDINNSFMSECMLFQDSAYIVFSRANHKSGNLEINLINDLDSSFIVMDSLTNFISIVDKKDTTQKTNVVPTNYSFTAQDRLFKTTMTEVIVKAKSKKIIDDFQKDNVSGLFAGADGTVIDGLESDDISRSVNLFNFLTGRVAGLSVKTMDDGTEVLMWRKHRTDIYLDEVKVDPELVLNISTFDIAMIKIFEPGTQVGFASGSGGTIAVYLKNGVYKKVNKPTNNFRISGYTALEAIWK
jgi:hypothetical protein